MCACCNAEAAALRLPPGAWELLDPRIAAVGVFAYDGVITRAIRGMKISGRWAAARHLSPAVIGHPAVPAGWPVTWVPSTRRRQRERGGDLPALLAGPEALPLLHRTVQRPDQTALSPAERRTSPQGCFQASGPVPRDVVLVDDVRTTGGTALAAAHALLDGGASRVLVVTLAVGGDDARYRRA